MILKRKARKITSKPSTSKKSHPKKPKINSKRKSSSIEKKRKDILIKLTNEKKKYVNHISPQKRKAIHHEIKKQRAKIQGHLSKLERIKLEALVKGKEFIWKPEMSVYETHIDQQHQKLLKQINLLMRSLSSEFNPQSSETLKSLRQTLHFLYTYILEHFSYEEDYMKKYAYPQLEVHKDVHLEFVKFFKELEQEFQTKIYTPLKPGEFLITRIQELIVKCKNFLGDWLVNHIVGMDHDYAEYITKKISKRESSASKSESITKEKELTSTKPVKKDSRKYIFTGIPGFDDLLEKGIPKSSSILVAGGAGSGKTIFCLQTLAYAASKGEKCLYLSFEESEERLKEHMEDFGWDWKNLEKKGLLKIVRKDPFVLTTSVEAMLAKARGELIIDIDEVIDIIPKGFVPDRIVIDSIAAIAAAFPKKGEGYRIFIEQLFRYLEKIEATTFLISETEQIPTVYSPEGIEEFMADVVIVLYAIKHNNIRENAIEVLKMRGAKHKKNIVALAIDNKGITVYPEQEIFT